MQSHYFTEEALRVYNELASQRYNQCQGKEHLDNDPPVQKKALSKKSAAKHQGAEFVDSMDQLEEQEENIEFSQPRCPVGQWRYPPQKGICTPKQQVIAQQKQSEKDRLNKALRNKLKDLKRAKKHQQEQKTKEKQTVTNKVVEAKSPNVTLEPNTIYGVLTDEGLTILNR